MKSVTRRDLARSSLPLWEKSEILLEMAFSQQYVHGFDVTHPDLMESQHNGEHNWEVAHRVLVPAFGPLNIRSMFDDMKDIASQLVMKWARHGNDYKVHVTDDFTRLTLDTLALCSMDYRFNSFYAEQMHPFVDAMVNVLSESGTRIRRPGFLAALYRKEEYQYWKDIKYLPISPYRSSLRG